MMNGEVSRWRSRRMRRKRWVIEARKAARHDPPARRVRPSRRHRFHHPRSTDPRDRARPIPSRRSQRARAERRSLVEASRDPIHPDSQANATTRRACAPRRTRTRGTRVDPETSAVAAGTPPVVTPTREGLRRRPSAGAGSTTPADLAPPSPEFNDRARGNTAVRGRGCRNRRSRPVPPAPMLS
jgi:hypothetical protein